jgi:hypothetical protein
MVLEFMVYNAVMPNVEFDLENELTQFHRKPTESYLVALVMKSGLVSTRSGANAVLLVAAILFTALTVWVILGVMKNNQVVSDVNYAQERRQ